MKTLQIALLGTAMLTGIAIDHLCTSSHASTGSSTPLTTDTNLLPSAGKTKDDLWEPLKVDNSGRSIAVCDELSPEAMRQLLGVFKP